MKMSAEAVWLLPLLLACLALAGGCSSAGARVPREGAIRVNRVPYRGWEDALLMTNGEVVVVVVPQVARIMKYALVDGENVLWVNDELAPEVTGSPGTQGPTKQWENFGGYKLWPAPEYVWGEPPPWELDRGACEVEIMPGGAVRLIGMPCPAFGMRFDREITLAPTGSRLEIKQTAVNVSDKPITASVWDVTQLKRDCVAFVPLGNGARYRASRRDGLDEQWSYVNDTLVLKPTGKNGKVFITGPPGWLGCKRGDAVYLKVFDIADAPTPSPETPREVYTGKGYIELEIVGPAVELQPGESTTLTEAWYLLPAGSHAETDEGLVKTAHDLMAALTAKKKARRPARQ